jgi:hypothetical protein
MLRAVATATSVCFEWPDFEITAGQKAAADALIQHLADARLAFRGQLDADDALDLHEGFPYAACVSISVRVRKAFSSCLVQEMEQIRN